MRASVGYEETTLERSGADASPREHERIKEPSPRPARRTATLHLERGYVFSKPLKKDERLLVTVTRGHAWITMDGDATDHVLSMGEKREFTGSGLLVIEGLEQGAREHLAPASSADCLASSLTMAPERHH